MSAHLDDISKIIQKAALDGALTEGAVKQFNEMIEANESQRKQLSSLRDDLAKATKSVDTLRKERDAAVAIRGTFKERIESLDVREKEMTKLEMTAANASARLQDHKEMMALIFKPGEVRREAWKSIPGFDEHGYPNSQTANENSSEQEHDE